MHQAACPSRTARIARPTNPQPTHQGPPPTPPLPTAPDQEQQQMPHTGVARLLSRLLPAKQAPQQSTAHLCTGPPLPLLLLPMPHLLPKQGRRQASPRAPPAAQGPSASLKLAHPPSQQYLPLRCVLPLQAGQLQLQLQHIRHPLTPQGLRQVWPRVGRWAAADLQQPPPVIRRA